MRSGASQMGREAAQFASYNKMLFCSIFYVLMKVQAFAHDFKSDFRLQKLHKLAKKKVLPNF